MDTSAIVRAGVIINDIKTAIVNMDTMVITHTGIVRNVVPVG